jgi:hypothetical protein
MCVVQRFRCGHHSHNSNSHEMGIFDHSSGSRYAHLLGPSWLLLRCPRFPHLFLFDSLLHPLCLPLGLGLIPELDLLLLWPGSLGLLLRPHFFLFLPIGIDVFITIVTTAFLEPMFRYPNALDGDGCVFVFVYVLIFLIDGLKFGRGIGAVRFLAVFFGIRRGFVLADIAICLLD